MNCILPLLQRKTSYNLQDTEFDPTSVTLSDFVPDADVKDFDDHTRLWFPAFIFFLIKLCFPG